MKKKDKPKIIKPEKFNKKWKVHQLFQPLIEQLDHLPDATAVNCENLNNAPDDLILMVF